VIDIPPECVDAHRFTALVAHADQLDRYHDRIPVLREALGLWHGPALADYQPEEIRQRLTARLDERRAEAHLMLLTAQIYTASAPSALPDLLELRRADPGDERITALLMLAYHHAGQPAAALAAFRALRVHLRDELGVDPGPEVTAVHTAVLRREPIDAGMSGLRTSGAAPAGPVGTGSSDLTAGGVTATHRFHGFRPFQLPPDLPDFVGRRAEIERLSNVLTAVAAGAYPTGAALSGAPGTGKSSLAVHVGHRLRSHYPDGQIYLDLAGDDIGPVATHDALGQALLALGFAAAGLPASSGDRAAALRSLCAERRLLLVLDNAQSIDQISALFPANPRCGVLVTSRARLGALSTWPHIEVAPLAHRRRAGDAAPHRRTPRVDAEPDAARRVADLCAGLPLALRIAGTRGGR